MQTIHSRTYTNVALTALILLLLVLALRPYVSAPTAYASAADLTISASGGLDPAKKAALLEDPYAGVAAALREVAAANKDVAAAIRETAKSQDNVAKAISALGAPMGAVMSIK